MNKFLMSLVMGLAFVGLSACGGGSSNSSGNGNGGGSGSSSATIKLTQGPPTTLNINQSAGLIATVSNDSTNSGVNWSCSPSASCGTFSSAHTASGAETFYFADGATGSVTITATAAGRTSQTVTATVKVAAIAAQSSLSGTFVFYLNGSDSSAVPYSVAGTVTLDGNGNVTSGEQDSFDGSSGAVDTQDAITSGTYQVDADGRGTINIATTNDGAETLGFSIVNSKHFLITEFDSTATSVGSMDLQTAITTVPHGGYSFATFDPNDEFVLGGVLVSDGSASFTTGTGDQAAVENTGSSDQVVVNTNLALTGSFALPDSFGRGTITINDSAASSGTLQFAYYAVGPEVYRLVEIDGAGSGFFAAGSMYGQGTVTSNLSAASLTGNYVFSEYGQSATAIGAIAAAGEFTSDGSAVISAGVDDVNDGGGTVVSDSALSGSYLVNPTGYGSVSLTTTATELSTLGIYIVDPTINIEDPNNPSGGGGALMTELDTALATGVVVPQTSTGTFGGAYGFDVQAVTGDSSSFDESDFLGTLSAAGGDIAGKIDLNDISAGVSANLAYTGSFSADTTHAGRLQLTTKTSAGTLVDAAGYESSTGQVLLVVTDTNVVGQGIVQRQTE